MLINRILIVGLGSIGKRHLRLARELFRLPHQRDDSYLAEWQNFIACVTEHKTPVITGEDGLKVLHIIEAARNSETSGGQMCEVGKVFGL
jgi:hypothetical protein